VFVRTHLLLEVIAPPKQPKRSRLTDATWRELKAAYFVGGELRALAREAGISENTVLHKAMRDGWTEQRRQALEKARQTRQELIVGESEGEPIQSLTISREGLLERHTANMMAISSRLSDYAAGLPSQTAFAAVRQIDVADRLTRRQLGLDQPGGVQINFAQAFWGPAGDEAADVESDQFENILDSFA
jgi:hypothetical protein